MTGLLVSVRSGVEAEVALAGGADVIDVKEPRRGALGAADAEVWREVLGVVRGRVVASAVLGELHSNAMYDYASRAVDFDYVKIGLSDAWRRNDTERKWVEACQNFASGARVVPVVYADIAATGARSFGESAMGAIGFARKARSPLVVVDTFDKRAGNLLDHVTVEILDDLSCAAVESDVRLVLAGSLDARAIEKVLPLAPAFIGVRGAACVGGRDGAIDLARVKSLAEIVQGGARKVAS